MKDATGTWERVTRNFPPAIDWDMQVGIIEGRIASFRKVMIGGDQREVVILEREDGTEFSLWISAGLRDILTLPIGERVRINYLGFVKNERTGRKFRAFELERWTSDIPF